MAIVTVPQLSDNYAYLVIDDGSKECAVVDCAEADKVIAAAKSHGAKIVVAPAVPDHFELAFSEGGQHRVCEVVWRRAKMIGVKFIF